ncbi:MAG: glycosyltransferase [Anaerolineales bacterium]
MTRILYFSRDYTPHDHRFLSALTENGHEVGYLLLEDTGLAREDRPVPAGVRLLPWAGGRTPFRWAAVPRLAVSLRKVVRTFQPEVIHAGPIQTAAFLTALAGFSQKLVSVSWGYDLLMDAPRSRWMRFVTRYTLRRSAAFVGDCETIRNLAVAYEMNPRRIVTFPWGVDLAHFTPAPKPPSQTFTVLSTRGWAPIYGVDVLARAFARFARRHPEARLVMLGNGPLAAELRSIFLRGGVMEQVTFPGLARYADLPRYYRMADLYLSASHSDGSSISLLEAMACGLPALVSDIPGNREWVTPEENGWWFRDGDARDLESRLEVAFQARARLPEMGRAARRTAESRADWRKNFPKLFDAYEFVR